MNNKSLETDNSLKEAHTLLDLMGIPRDGSDGIYSIAGRIEILRQALAIEGGLKTDQVGIMSRRFVLTHNFKTLESWNALFTLPKE